MVVLKPAISRAGPRAAILVLVLSAVRLTHLLMAAGPHSSVPLAATTYSLKYSQPSLAKATRFRIGIFMLWMPSLLVIFQFCGTEQRSIPKSLKIQQLRKAGHSI